MLAIIIIYSIMIQYYIFLNMVPQWSEEMESHNYIYYIIYMIAMEHKAVHIIL